MAGLRLVTNAIVRHRFNPKIIASVREAVRKEAVIFKKLWKEATPDEKKILEKALSEEELKLIK